MTLKEKIINIVESVKRIPIKVEEKSNLYSDLGVDSITFIGFLLRVEEKFSISFDIDEMEQCLRVDQLIKLVNKKLKESGTDYN